MLKKKGENSSIILRSITKSEQAVFLKGAISGRLSRKKSGLRPDRRRRITIPNGGSRANPLPSTYPVDALRRRFATGATMAESFNCIEILANKCAGKFVNKSTSQPARRILPTASLRAHLREIRDV